MKRVMTALLGMALLVPISGFAQTGGDSKSKGKSAKKADHKGGKKSKKGSGGTTTQPPK